ncbi:hypothetical protein BTA51_21305 [Hahella sp. CCB-MM4]|uniref:PilW family protein n=1 Tax=Hahella sp. (strain CCB-MM4) TaxID=1926491 RepID=UPI000B9B6EED|nr:PilW family protein [Hahella sp. CCB-MM4]OZG71475.1 hypothetical protein BTA51_21305 [Hahella sp. CCB-MM4]
MNRKQSGLSLVEVMIALALSAVLVLGLAQVFGSSREANRLQSGLARVQESGRVGMEILGRDIRNGAYLGCAKWASMNNIFDRDKWEGKTGASDSTSGQVFNLSADSAIVGYNDITATAGDLSAMGLSVGTDPGDLIEKTDALVLQGAGPCDGGKVVSYNESSAQFKIEDATSCGLSQNDVVIVSNCQNADLFAISNVPTASGANKDTVTHANDVNTDNKLEGSYGGSDSEILTFYSKAYYVGMGSDGRNSLYLRQLEGASYVSHELVEGIEDMQLLMGEDSDEDGSVNRYLEPEDASLVESRIVSIKVTFSLTSEENITLAGDQFEQDLESVFAIRNRL